MRKTSTFYKIRMVIIVIFLIALFAFKVYANSEDVLLNQKNDFNILGFIDNANKYVGEIFDNIEINDVFNDAIKGDFNNIFIKKIINHFAEEFLKSLSAMGIIIVIIIIHSVLKTFTDNLENKSVSQMVYYSQYIMIVTIIMSNFSKIIKIVISSTEELISFINLLLPVLMSLMLSTGNIVSVSVLQPIILFVMTIISNFILKFIIPFLLITTTLTIVSKISDNIQIDKLTKFFKSSIVWILGIILTVFVGVTSLEGNLSSSVDGLTVKTAKATVSSAVPIVGKILGDAVDTVLGCGNILKNAVGFVGIIVIISICIIPIIKLAIYMLLYYLISGIAQPFADNNIVKLLEQIGDTYKVLLAIQVSVSIMLIIGITLVMNISNGGLMYR